MTCSPAGKATSVSAPQDEKVLLLMTVTLSEYFTDFRFLQFENAHPTLFTPLLFQIIAYHMSDKSVLNAFFMF